jgi:predicted ArsR family transcriptional regulator
MQDPDFTMKDLLIEILQQQYLNTGGGVSAEEIADQLGCSSTWVHRRLRSLAKSGKLVVRFQTRMRSDGRPCKVPVYSLKGDSEVLTSS